MRSTSAARTRVAQMIQPRAVQCCAAMAVVPEDVLLIDCPALTDYVLTQPVELLINRLGQGLAIGRDTCIECNLHLPPPVREPERDWRRLAAVLGWRTAASVEKRDPTGCVRPVLLVYV